MECIDTDLLGRKRKRIRAEQTPSLSGNHQKIHGVDREVAQAGGVKIVFVSWDMNG